MINPWKKWEQDMKQWCKDIIAWQKQNPDKDWLQGMADAEGPGSNPPPPPPPPPTHG